jgi:hypothetical protein
MATNIKYFIVLVLIGITFASDTAAQDGEKKISRLRVEYVKDSDGSESILATLIRKEDRYLPYKDAEINFYNVKDTVKLLLGEISTDENGEARYLMEDLSEIYLDSSGFMNFVVDYQGNSSTEGANNEIKIKKSDLKISFLQEDSTKFIAVHTNEIKADHTIVPIEGIDISLFIKGTFSLLKIGEEETDEGGRFMLEFPVDMPGDTAGVLTIVAKIESDIYGNVEAEGVMNWGKPMPLPQEKQRGLGDTDAPLWMVYTLIVLLSAVWFHYLYVIFTIIKIKLLRSAI